MRRLSRLGSFLLFGLAFGIIAREDVEIHGGVCRDILERDAVLAEDVGVAVGPDLGLRGLELADDGLELGMFFDARRGFVESGHDISKEDGVERARDDVCGGEFAVDSVDDMHVFEPRQDGLDGGDGIDALARERFGCEWRIARAEVAHERREDFERRIFADEHPFALDARGLVKTSLELEGMHVLHDVAGFDAEEEHHPGEV